MLKVLNRAGKPALEFWRDIMNFKSKFKLEFEIETNSENMPEVLEIITNNISKELNDRLTDKTEIICNAEITKIEL